MAHGVGGEIFHPGGVTFRLDVDAVRLRVLSFQVAIVIGKGFPQVQKSAVPPLRKKLRCAFAVR